jgi:hypothetical protein|tara:strand:+ start:160 stop:336 length:177 start_codon:yes stop_codon:yes gene_type:complete
MPGNWDGKSRPVNDKYRENFNDIFGKKKNKKGYKEASLGSFFDSCLSPEEKKKRKKDV